MEKELLYEDKNLRLEYIPDGNYLHETWWGYTPGEKFRKLLDVIIDCLEKKKASGLILDAREHKGLGPDSQKLAAERHGEYAKTYGQLNQAIVVPKDVFSKFSVTNYSTKFDPNAPVASKYFDNLEDAAKWLKNGGQ